nr:MAG TPA: hypothetical protein [Caudoviricetes sp.]
MFVIHFKYYTSFLVKVFVFKTRICFLAKWRKKKYKEQEQTMIPLLILINSIL